MLYKKKIVHEKKLQKGKKDEKKIKHCKLHKFTIAYHTHTQWTHWLSMSAICRVYASIIKMIAQNEPHENHFELVATFDRNIEKPIDNLIKNN